MEKTEITAIEETATEPAGQASVAAETLSPKEERIREAEFLANLGLGFENRKRFQEGMDYYQKSRRLFESLGQPDQAAFQLMNIGRALGKMEDNLEAIRHYRQAAQILEEIQDTPTLNECVKELCRYLYRTGKPDEAATEYRRAVEKGHADAEIYNNLGFISLEKGDLKTAREHLEESLKKKQEENHPQLDLTLNNLGVLEYLEGNIDEAVARFTSAAQLNPRGEEEDRTIALVLLYSKGYEESGAKPVQTFDNAFTKAAQYLNAATALASQRKSDQAVEMLDKALELDRDALYLYYPAAWIHLAAGNKDKALDYFRRSHNLSGHDEVIRAVILNLNPYFFTKAGRNEPCPCGSGKKFKKCHGAS
jgi:tetratricopeptide (TPR) repeat protein